MAYSVSFVISVSHRRLVHISFDQYDPASTTSMAGLEVTSLGGVTSEWHNSFFLQAIYVKNEQNDGGIKVGPIHYNDFTNIGKLFSLFNLGVCFVPLSQYYICEERGTAQ